MTDESGVPEPRREVNVACLCAGIGPSSIVVFQLDTRRCGEQLSGSKLGQGLGLLSRSYNSVFSATCSTNMPRLFCLTKHIYITDYEAPCGSRRLCASSFRYLVVPSDMSETFIDVRCLRPRVHR